MIVILKGCGVLTCGGLLASVTVTVKFEASDGTLRRSRYRASCGVQLQPCWQATARHCKAERGKSGRLYRLTIGSILRYLREAKWWKSPAQAAD